MSMLETKNIDYVEHPKRYIGSSPGEIADFLYQTEMNNVDQQVVDSFGDEWTKFNSFDDNELATIGDEYFDILPESIYNTNTTVLDVGCGTGRWTKYLCNKVGFVDAVDPSEAILIAQKILSGKNVRFTKATTDNLPFPISSYDLVMSIGVLHHIPNTATAMQACVEKVKKGGYFYVYLYYDFENRGVIFKTLFGIADIVRRMVSHLPSKIKKIVCEMIAVTVYLPFIFLSRFLFWMGFKKISNKIPLSYYRNKSFFIVRNDALDRFGTKLEQRFSKRKIEEMMTSCGLTNIQFSNYSPFWHAIGIKQ